MYINKDAISKLQSRVLFQGPGSETWGRFLNKLGRLVAEYFFYILRKHISRTGKAWPM
jgi:hypothetical protein